MSVSVIGSTGNSEFDAHILRIDRNQELKKKFGISYTRFAEIDPTPVKKWLIKDFLGAGEMRHGVVRRFARESHRASAVRDLWQSQGLVR